MQRVLLDLAGGRQPPPWKQGALGVSPMEAQVMRQTVVTVKGYVDQQRFEYLQRRAPPRPDEPLGRLPDGIKADHSVREGELVFTDHITPGRWQKYTPNEISLPVFSAVNGLDLSRDTVTFVGLANKPSGEVGQGKVTEVTVQVAGSHTVFNNGPDNIYEGELVLWAEPYLDHHRKPVHRYQGQSDTRFVVSLHALRLQDLFTRFRGWLESAFAARGAGAALDPRVPAQLQARAVWLANFSFCCSGEKAVAEGIYNMVMFEHVQTRDAELKELEDQLLRVSGQRRRAVDAVQWVPVVGALRQNIALVRQFADYQALMQTRVIGRALTYAAPGERFDLLLGAK